MGHADASYRRLFAHRELMRDLLACVLDARLFALLDWARMEPVPTNFVAQHLQQRTGDGAWRIPYGSNRSRHPRHPRHPRHLYVLLLFEHQSRSDAMMALRMAVYAGLLYESLLRDGRLAPPLPPLLPVVLYAGQTPWRAAPDLAALLSRTPRGLRPYQLGMRYLLVAERELLAAGGLPDHNLAALVFRMGANPDLEQWRTLLHTLVQVVRGPGHEELERGILSWLTYVASSRAAVKLPSVTNLQEFEMMISEQPGIWAKQWKQEGLLQGKQEGLVQGKQEGLVQGKQEGLQQGQAELLLRMLERRFGAVPDDTARRVQAADKPSLEHWAMNLLEAATLDDVFRD